MERDYSKEIDEIKEELASIRSLLMRKAAPIPAAAGSGKEGQVLSAEGRERMERVQEELMAYTDLTHTGGAVAYAGTFVTADGDSARQSMWLSAVDARDLLKLNESRLAERVLTSVGNAQRLAILLALLQAPMTVAQLAEHLGSNTTGQVYHHLKPLLMADILFEEKGVYVVKPYRVQGIIMLLAGVKDLVDPQYSAGEWEA